MSNIEELIRQAKEGAAAAPAANASTELAPVAPQGSVSTDVTYGGGQKSLEELAASASPTVAAYLKVKHEGIYVGESDKTQFETLKVRIRGSEIMSYTAIAYGNPAKYGRTLDGRVEAFTGKPWDQFCKMAVAQGSKGPYDSADIPMYAAEDIISQRGDNKNKPIVKKGETLGFTTSKSAMREVKTFIREVILKRGAGVLLEGTVKLKPLKNESGEWGVLDFGKIDNWTVVDEAAEDGE